MINGLTRENEIAVVKIGGEVAYATSVELLSGLKRYWNTDKISHIMIEEEFLAISCCVSGKSGSQGCGHLDEDFNMEMSDLTIL